MHATFIKKAEKRKYFLKYFAWEFTVHSVACGTKLKILLNIKCAI